MEMDDFLNQFTKLKQKELEQKVWEIWLARYPHMTEDNFTSYEELLNQATQQETQIVNEVDYVANGYYVDQIGF